MDFRNAFKWSLLYRGIATGAFLLGIVLVGLGVVAGFGSAVSTLVANPLNPGDAIAQANPTLTIAFCILGLVVWQFGKTYALFVTVPRAAGRSAARQFDTERVKSELLEVLDDRLAEIHEDVERTRLAVDERAADGLAADERAADGLAADELEDDPAAAEHAATYDESETLESSSAAAAGATSTSAESAATSPTSATASAASSTADGSAAADARDESTRDGDADYGADAAESDDPLN